MKVWHFCSIPKALGKVYNGAGNFDPDLLGFFAILNFFFVTKDIFSNFFFKSNERSLDSYIGLADFFFFSGVANNYRGAFIHIDAFMNAFFEFN